MAEKRNRQEIATEKEKKNTICVQQGLLGSQVHLLADPSPTACHHRPLAHLPSLQHPSPTNTAQWRRLLPPYYINAKYDYQMEKCVNHFGNWIER